MKMFTDLKNLFGIFIYLLICGTFVLTSSPVWAGEADVLDVKIAKTDADMFRFSVTVRHEDQGWDHYADKWDVLDMDGNVLGTRVLMHPHDNEQPFTRSMKISIPMHVKKVTVRAHDKVHGYGGAEIVLKLPNS
ncbi:hypothetical protein [Sneathiella limimaris]|uniref:hypothetical protein n=1 Tax=Sneathiella limimaris TaxID=1964213 RepID=UPI0019D0140F|nr:hypothetical protein [Sneathiella limimaris]